MIFYENSRNIHSQALPTEETPWEIWKSGSYLISPESPSYPWAYHFHVAICIIVR